MMKISAISKFVDQPLLVNNLQRKMPALLIGGAAVFGICDTLRKPKEERKKQAIRNAIILPVTVLFSLIGTRGITIGGKRFMNGLMETVPREELIKTQTEAIDKYLRENPQRDPRLTEILQRVKKIPLTLKEVKELLHKMPDNEKTKELFGAILSDNKTLDSKEIFSEIGRLSLLGAVPVVGGLAGGILADKVVKDNSKKSVANKFKEGIYQYFANIFLCNVGAGLFLFGMEKLTKAHIIKNLTPSKKLVGVLAGILTTGVAFGSLIANFIGKKVVDPLLSLKGHNHSLYSERKPEALDIALHVDDIATAGVLSGLKWIEPVLPLMYMISGYRAGVGYRNNHHEQKSYFVSSGMQENARKVFAQF